MSTHARVVSDVGSLEVLAPGPLAVAPEHQRRGIGTTLLSSTLDRARGLGFPAAFLYGDPGYYPRFGFRDAATLHVTTADGDNFPDFMGMELVEGSLAGVRGRLVESSLFEFDRAEVDAFDARFRTI